MDALMKQLVSDAGGEEDEAQAAASRKGHSDTWYAERCIFCAQCRTTINAQFQKRGQRCQVWGTAAPALGVAV
jgi:hypothetical protein